MNQGFLRRDPSPRTDRLLVVLDQDVAGEPSTGAQFRDRGLLEAIRSHVPTDVLSFRALRSVVGCEVQCQSCLDYRIDTGEGSVRFPFAWRTCLRSAQQLHEILESAEYRAVVVSDIELHLAMTAARTATSAPLVLDLHNAEATLYEEMHRHPLWNTLVGSFDSMIGDHLEAMHQVEAQILEMADVVTVPSQQDRVRIADRHGETGTPIMVLPNTVPVPERLPDPALLDTCLFFGTLLYFPNMLAALEMSRTIGPAVRASCPELRLVVAGHRPPPIIEQELADGPIELHPDVPDLAPRLSRSVVVVPLSLGGGTRLKILESFAGGAPVVSTAKGMEGIDAKPHKHYLPAETPEEFAVAVRQIVNEPGEAARLREAAWALVRGSYSWQALSGRIRPLLNRIGL